MRQPARQAFAVGAAIALATAMPVHAQSAKPIASVSGADATVVSANAGVMPANSGRIDIVNGSKVTAKDHTAPVKLERGGEVRVCQTSSLHLNESPDESLLLALDRGAMEIRVHAKAGDVVMTPDLRFTMSDAGPLELEMRVSTSGDTCVDNRGRHAPTLKIADAFGEASYELKPGQHVTFEHGSLREVVDRETVPCGCPPPDHNTTNKTGSLADAALAGGGKMTPAQADAAHPFPVAISEGLAPPSPVPPEPAGQTHVQVASTLAYDPDAPKAAESSPTATQEATAGQAPAPVPTSVPASAAAPQKPGSSPFGAIGRFFKRLFVR